MLKHVENSDGLWLSINGSLAAIAKVCLILERDGQLEKVMERLPDLIDRLMPPDDEPDESDAESTAMAKDQYEEEELMTIKEAVDDIPVSRSKLFEWRREGRLQTIERNSRSKRLIRSEVKAMQKWAHNKGKR